MKCKICKTNETNNTSGICDECVNVLFLEIMKKAIKKEDKFDPLEKAFKNWLEGFEIVTTERWDKLSIEEIDVLMEYYWQEFFKKYKDLKR